MDSHEKLYWKRLVKDPYACKSVFPAVVLLFVGMGEGIALFGQGMNIILCCR